jgi:Fe-Mn family superoxide dismutase
MTFSLPELPYDRKALAPNISEETLDFHYGKHHQAYVNNLNKLIEGTELASKSLEDIITTSTGGIFNNAAQVWNHTFYWHSLSPNGGGEPTGALLDAINKDFGSFVAFKEQFSKAATTHFASGWAWLAKNQNGKLEVFSTVNAGTPMTENKQALLTCDVWEHAYYIDTRNDRAKYVGNFWELVNWDFVAENLTRK